MAPQDLFLEEKIMNDKCARRSSTAATGETPPTDADYGYQLNRALQAEARVVQLERELAEDRAKYERLQADFRARIEQPSAIGDILEKRTTLLWECIGMLEMDEEWDTVGSDLWQLRQRLESALSSAREAQPTETLTPLERYALTVLDEHRRDLGDLDAGWLQEKGEEVGLLESVRVNEACGELCRCAEYDEFPQDCLRLKKEFEPKMAANRAQRAEERQT